MRLTWVAVLGGALVLACGASRQDAGGAAVKATGGSSGSETSGSSGTAGSSTMGSSGSSSGSSEAGAAGTSDNGEAGAPPTVDTGCALPATEVDTSSPTTVVGGGSAAGCTEAALRAAVAKGGIVVFDCGNAPVTITLSSEILVAGDTTLDGGGLVTLSGGGASRILHVGDDYYDSTPVLTVQHLAFEDGYTTDEFITLSRAQSGGAIFLEGASLVAIDCTFSNNQCAGNGGYVTGGAIGGYGEGTIVIQASRFSGNSGSNGGAIGMENKDVTIVSSIFTGNHATGIVGFGLEGGAGGAISHEALGHSLTLCGDVFRGNVATEVGGALFRIGFDAENDPPSTVDISRSTFDRNGERSSPGIGGAIGISGAIFKLSDSTVSGNVAGVDGGGISLSLSDGIVDFTNVTIVNNNSLGGGGVQFGGQVKGKLTNLTVSGNDGGGLYGAGPDLVLRNSIIANNLAGNASPSNPSCDSSFVDRGPNLQFPMFGAACTSSIVSADPELGPLEDNGGPTKTLRPAADSTAKGLGLDCPAMDQTGALRPTPCSLGAVEAG
jgi:hypothetical protein